MIALDLVKQYLRIDGNYEDELLEFLIDNAEYYIEDTIENLDLDNDKVAKKAQLMALVLISDWYENREYVNIGKVSNDIRYTIMSLRDQIQAISLGDEYD